MPSFQSSGIASGIDINGLVTQLVATERAPAAQRLQRYQDQIDGKISALGVLKSSLSTLQTSLGTLKSETVFQVRKTSSTDDKVFTATATPSAAPGNYNVEVIQLAKAHKLSSAAFATGSSAVVGTGTLSVAVGSATFDVVINSTNSTLASVRDAINAAPDNKGVRASLIATADGARLVLTSNKTGLASALRVTQAGGDGGLSVLVYDPGVSTTLTQLDAALDAQAKLEGNLVTSSNNIIEGAIDGVTITLKDQKPGTILTLGVSNDSAAAIDRVKKFVTDTNSALVTMRSLRSYNAATKVAGPLLGDSILRDIEAQVRRELITPATTGVATVNTLASIGIITNADGSLKLDEVKLTAALTGNFDSVGKLFGAADGVGKRLSDALTRFLDSSAQIATRTETLTQNKRGIERDRSALDARMNIVEQRYRKQFQAMDRILTDLQSTSSYIAQQLGSPSKVK